MRKIRRISSLLFYLVLTACVTINVYFPAAAAESAADKLIKEVYGIEKSDDVPETEMPEPEASSSQNYKADAFMLAVLNYLVPMAHAQQADINISTPGIKKLKSIMKARHKKLAPYYSSSAVGMEGNGLITIKDIKAVSLKERNTVKKLVSDENRDRNALYQEIAKANGHAEWESEIRDIFARRWVANAPNGWWYVSGDSWKQK